MTFYLYHDIIYIISISLIITLRSENIMNPHTDLLAFLYTIAAENIENDALGKLGTQLDCKPVNWQAVDEKLKNIFIDYPELEQTYIHYQTQLDTKDKQLLLDLLPSQEELNKNSELLARSGIPGSDDPVTIEITNTAVVILKNDNPIELSKKLLKPLNETLQEQGNN